MGGVMHVLRETVLARAMNLPTALFALLACAICLFGISWPLEAAHAEDMSFQLVSVSRSAGCGDQCPSVITAQGQITDSTPSEFLSFVQGNIGRSDLHAVVFLDSPGGKVVAAMELGRLWRRLGIAAIVGRADPGSSSASQFLAGRCLSACVYALIGAKKRVVPDGSMVGIHRMFFYDGESGLLGDGSAGRRHYDDGGMKALLSHYTSRMGVSPELISIAERISSDNIHILSRAEIARYHLATAKF
jgi:hypothetical protein